MNVSTEMIELFNKDCAHTAEVIMRALVSDDGWSSFTISDVPVVLFDNDFISTVARYLGGKVINGSIHYEDKTIWFTFDPSVELYGYYPDVEVSFECM